MERPLNRSQSFSRRCAGGDTRGGSGRVLPSCPDFLPGDSRWLSCSPAPSTHIARKGGGPDLCLLTLAAPTPSTLAVTAPGRSYSCPPAAHLALKFGCCQTCLGLSSTSRAITSPSPGQRPEPTPHLCCPRWGSSQPVVAPDPPTFSALLVMVPPPPARRTAPDSPAASHEVQAPCSALSPCPGPDLSPRVPHHLPEPPCPRVPPPLAAQWCAGGDFKIPWCVSRSPPH